MAPIQLNHMAADDGSASLLPEWLTVQQAAMALNTGPRTIYVAIRRRELRAASVNRRGDLRIHRDWLKGWMEARAVKVS